MDRLSDKKTDFLREELIGLGEHSIRKNYYPELQKRLEELETFRNLLDKVNEGILMMRLPSGEIVDANEAACSILGFTRNGLFASNLAELLPAASAALERLGSSPRAVGWRQDFKMDYRRTDDSHTSLEGSLDVVELSDNIFAVAILRDVSERKRTDAMLHHASSHDSLTGLYNRVYLEYEFEKRSHLMKLPCALVECDIDGLQMTNETLGHAAGDQRLIMTAVLMSELTEKGDILARIGGDEFALICPGADRKDAENICHRLREAVESYNAANKDIFLSLSIGYAIADSRPIKLNELLRDADNLVRREKLLRSQSTRSGIVSTVMTLLEARDFITEGHAERLEILVSGMGEKLGFASSRQDAMKLFAKCHDIGKVGVSDTILFKPGTLNNLEWEEMRRHSEIGYRIALSSVDLMHIAEWILRHHEWWNGSGYPIGLKGTDIPLECRILTIADAFDAMTSDRPYRKAMPVEAAVIELRKFAGIQFDPDLLDPFCELLQKRGKMTGTNT